MGSETVHAGKFLAEAVGPANSVPVQTSPALVLDADGFVPWRKVTNGNSKNPATRERRHHVYERSDDRSQRWQFDRSNHFALHVGPPGDEKQFTSSISAADPCVTRFDQRASVK